MELVWRDLAGFRPHVLRTLGLRRRTGRLSPPQRERLRSEEAHAELAAVLPRLYAEVRVYHACRPESLDSYATHGLCPLDTAKADQLAREIFLAGDPNLTEENLRVAIEELRPDGREGRLYLALDDRLLVRDCGHYLIYGSEYLCAVAMQLSEFTGVDYQAWLRRRGTPTVITASLPMSEVPTWEVEQLAAAMCREIASDPEFEFAESEPVDFTFSRRTGLAPTRLRGHYHPEVVPDPFRSMIPYRWQPSSRQ